MAVNLFGTNVVDRLVPNGAVYASPVAPLDDVGSWTRIHILEFEPLTAVVYCP